MNGSRVEAACSHLEQLAFDFQLPDSLNRCAAVVAMRANRHNCCDGEPMAGNSTPTNTGSG